MHAKDPLPDLVSPPRIPWWKNSLGWKESWESFVALMHWVAVVYLAIMAVLLLSGSAFYLYIKLAMYIRNLQLPEAKNMVEPRVVLARFSLGLFLGGLAYCLHKRNCAGWWMMLALEGVVASRLATKLMLGNHEANFEVALVIIMTCWLVFRHRRSGLFAQRQTTASAKP